MTPEEQQQVNAMMRFYEAQIVAELKTVQGKPVEIGSYYRPDAAKASVAMRPSATFNSALAMLG